MTFDTIIGHCHLCGAKNLLVAVLGDRDESGPLLVCGPCLEDARAAVSQREILEQAEATP